MTDPPDESRYPSMPDQKCAETLTILAEILDRAHQGFQSVERRGADGPIRPHSNFPIPANITPEQAMAIVRKVSVSVAVRFPSMDRDRIIALVVRNVLSRLPDKLPAAQEREEDVESLASDGVEMRGFGSSSDSSDCEVSIFRFSVLIVGIE